MRLLLEAASQSGRIDEPNVTCCLENKLRNKLKLKLYCNNIGKLDRVAVCLLRVNNRHKYVMFCLLVLSLHAKVHVEGEMRRRLTDYFLTIDCKRTKELFNRFCLLPLLQ
jgi:hypothetical protein